MTPEYSNYFKNSAKDWHHNTHVKRTAFKPYHVGKFVNYPKQRTFAKQTWQAKTLPWNSKAFVAQQKWRRTYYKKRN